MVSIHKVDSTLPTGAAKASAQNPQDNQKAYLYVRILLVEDDLMVGESIRDGLKKHGFAVDWVTTGTAAEAALTAHSHDLVLLDLGLPRKPGIEVLRDLRDAGDNIPVLIITARDTVTDRILGLDSGADDYLVKPFDLGELAARVRALARRRGGNAAPVLKNGNLMLDLSAREVTYKGTVHSLPSRELALLHALMERPGQILSTRQLEERLYGWEESIESNTVEVRVHHIRRRLGSDVIANVRGVGYMVPKQK
jgi:two-component system response regulator QseB